MDVEGRGYITFEDFLRNKPAVKEMQAKFRTLDKSGKGFITMTDLPRLN
jgi:Ca2+-binding EF-hand superfamily protein